VLLSKIITITVIVISVTGGVREKARFGKKKKKLKV
jgi:hypothetical protein